MKPIVLEYKLTRRGERRCSFPECQKQKGLLDHQHHRLCPIHYDYICSRNAGQEPPMCEVLTCYKISHLVIHEGRLICQSHYRKISSRRPVFDDPNTCYIDTCPDLASHELRGKRFCAHHHHQLKNLTETPPINPDECNYVGCHEFWSVSGFNNRWCPKHYLEMCRIRESIRHDDSETDLAARLKEIKVRKDSCSETGLRHRWYYLQRLLSSRTK